MNRIKSSRIAIGTAMVALASLAFADQAAAMEIFGGPNPVLHSDDSFVSTVGVHRGGGGGMHRGHRGGANMNRNMNANRNVNRNMNVNRNVNRNVNANVNRNRNVNVNANVNRVVYRGGVYRGAWVGRPYRWAPGGAIAAGAAIGVVAAGTAVAWAPAPPQAGLCWYYTDATQRNGFWDTCP